MFSNIKVILKCLVCEHSCMKHGKLLCGRDFVKMCVHSKIQVFTCVDRNKNNKCKKWVLAKEVALDLPLILICLSVFGIIIHFIFKLLTGE